jgi:tRNA G10  N-methylase Trm11
MQLAILGRQPALSCAELEALYSAEAVTRVSDEAALVQSNAPLPQDQLGGTMKSGLVLEQIQDADLSEIFSHLEGIVPDLAAQLPDGKVHCGVSVYGEKAQKNWLLKQLLTLKKAVKKTGRSIRIIENKSEALEAAQVLYNKLTAERGIEIIIVKHGAGFIIARTTAVQNFDDYAARDHGRPKRDAFVGMLPPKLAQIMINLGCSSQDRTKTFLLDPFCGTGVIPQEALLMGAAVMASDLSEKMVDYTTANLRWLEQSIGYSGRLEAIQHADATSTTWPQAEQLSAIVCETYLGTPLSGLPSPAKLDEIIDEANEIASGFLKNIAPQIAPKTRLCVALPAWNLGNEKYKHLKVLDSLEKLGYNRVEFVHANEFELIYHRPDQIVARQLTILEKK